MNIEIERKYLIKLPDKTDRLSENCGYRKRHITQTYLKRIDSEIERRVRKIVENGDITYIYTEKRHHGKISRYESEHEIPESEYNSLLADAESSLEKTRYSFPFDGHIMEIDVYPDEIGGELLRGLAILEIELRDENEKISFPPELTVLREVTNLKQYSNKALAVLLL